jgi:hypothetical protein
MEKGQRLEESASRRVRDSDLWEHRYTALERMITTLHKQVNDHKPGGEGCEALRQETFRVLLENLKAFAGAQFRFLHRGLGSQLDHPRPPKAVGIPKAEPGYLEPSLDYPADFVLGATLDQIAFDLAVLQGAWNQRVLAETNQEMCRTLGIADRLAFSALQPALEYKLLPFTDGQLTVLTYFQKASYIRMIPYASVALVGIPFTTLGKYDPGHLTEVGNARDLLAIPHEIGHYVFRHGAREDSRLQHALQEALLGQPEWLHRWAEEIFADVYGVLIAGPVIVRDFQDIMRDNDLPSLLNGDSTHPAPVLRPLIYADALELLAEKAQAPESDALKALAEEARERWKSYRGSRGEKEITDKLETIQRAVRTTFEILVKAQPVTIGDLWSLPDITTNIDTDERYKALYEEFYQTVAAQLSPNELPELDTNWDTPLQMLPTLQWLERIRNEVTEGNIPPGRFPPEVWTLVVSMAGWATNGPTEQPSPRVI